MTISLIGYRGSGKSSVGLLLAERLGYECIDSDNLIEAAAGITIADIFATKGEAEFRRLETETIAQLVTRQNVVLAVGGGAILAEINRERLKSAGHVVWLRASTQVLAERIGADQKSSTQRPSLTGKSIEEEVADVLCARMPLYAAAATIEIETAAMTPSQICDEIICKIDVEGQSL